MPLNPCGADPGIEERGRFYSNSGTGNLYGRYFDILPSLNQFYGKVFKEVTG
jgi:hypothetical protein